jgi:hypothetical protein
MKFNFRKIASVLTSAVMLSSTVAFAAAASFPAPFVKNGAGDYAVVYGSTAVAGTDNVAAADINAFLTGKVTTPTTASVMEVTAPTDGDFVMLERTSDKFNLGDQTDDFQTSLDSEDLPVILEDGVYTNDASDDFDYEQSITLAALDFSWQQDNRYNGKMPFIGFDLVSGDSILNYTLDFTDSAESVTWGSDSELIGTVMKMLGREYYISDVSYSASTGVKLTLLDTANSVRIAEGDSQILSAGGDNYEVKLLSVSDGTTDSVSISVDGVEISTDLEEGDTAKVKGKDVYVGVKKISTSSKETITNTAIITLGTGQLVLENGQEVELNGDPLSDDERFEDYTLNAYITNSSFDIEDITLEWLTNDNVWLDAGNSLVMPGFEAVKLSMGNFVTSDEEITEFDDDDDSLRVRTVIEDGNVEFSLFYGNETTIQGLGRASDEDLVTNFTIGGSSTTTERNISLAVDENSMFVATWISGDDAESYVYRIKSVANDNKTILENMADGGSDITLTEVTDEDDNNRMTFTLKDASASADTAIVAIAPSSGGTVYIDRVVTKAGLQFMLPLWNVTVGTPAYVGPSSSSWILKFTEEEEDSNDIGTGQTFNITLAPSDDGAEVSSVTETSDVVLYPEKSSSDLNIGYVISDYATYLEHNDDSNVARTLKVGYHGEESYGEIYVTESTVTFDEDGSGGSSGSMVVMDSEVSSVSSKNLIVIGGSCVNTVAAKLLGSDSPLCGADWTAKTTAGAGAFLIETYDNPWSAGKVATLVAGYDASDTTNAGNALKTETIDTTVGMKYVKLAGSTLQLV